VDSPGVLMRRPNRPVLVLLLAIAQLMVGGMLLCGGALNLIINTAGSSAQTVTITTNGKSTTRVYDTREEMEKEAPGYKLFLHGGGIVGFALAAVMVAAAIGLLGCRGWAWWLSVLWGLFELAYQIATAAYLWLVAMPAANRMVRAVPRDDAGVCGGLVNGNTLYHVGWALFASGFVLYPLLILLLLVLPPVRRACLGAAENQMEDIRSPRRRYYDEE